MKTQNKAGEEVNKGFEDLKAWQLARQLMIECHELANRLPAFERHDLVSQIRRSSKSVMANIAEGYGRYHYLDSLRFYYFARGSLTETISHLITAHDLKYTNAEQHQTLYDLSREAERTLNGYINFTWKQQQGRNHYGERYITDATADHLPPAKPDAS
jgi:four helix bundle protein